MQHDLELLDCDRASFDLHYQAAWVQLHRRHEALHSDLAASLVASSAAALAATSTRTTSALTHGSSSLSPSTTAAAAAVLSSVQHPPPPTQPRGGRPTAEFNYLFEQQQHAQRRSGTNSTTIGAANRERDRRDVFAKFGALPESGSRTAQLYAKGGALLAVGYLRLLFGDEGPFFELTHSNVNWAVFSRSGPKTLVTNVAPPPLAQHSSSLSSSSSPSYHSHVHVARVKVLATRAQILREQQAARKKWERDVDHRESALSFYLSRQQSQPKSPVGSDSLHDQNNLSASLNNHNASLASANDFSSAVSAGGFGSMNITSGPDASAQSFGTFFASGAGSKPGINAAGSVDLSQQQLQHGSLSLLDCDDPADVPALEPVACLREQLRDVRSERNPPPAAAGAANAPLTASNYRLEGFADYIAGRLYLSTQDVALVVLPASLLTPERVLEQLCGADDRRLFFNPNDAAQAARREQHNSLFSRALTATSSAAAAAALSQKRQQQYTQMVRLDARDSIATALKVLGDNITEYELWRELAGSRIGGVGAGRSVYGLGALLRVVTHDPGSAKRLLVYLRVLDGVSSSSSSSSSATGCAQLSERRIAQLLAAAPLHVRCPELATQRWLVDAERFRVDANGQMLPSPHLFDREEEARRRRQRRRGLFDEFLFEHRGAIAAAVAFCEVEHRGRLSVVVLAGRGIELCETPKADRNKSKTAAEAAAVVTQSSKQQQQKPESNLVTTTPAVDFNASGLTGDPLLDDALEFEALHSRGGGAGFVSRFAALRSGAQNAGADGGGSNGSGSPASALLPMSPAAAAAAKVRLEQQRRQESLLALRRQRLLAARLAKPIEAEAPRPFRFFLSFDDGVVTFLAGRGGDAAKTGDREKVLDEALTFEEIGDACWSAEADPVQRPLLPAALLESIFTVEWTSMEAFASFSRGQGVFDRAGLEQLMMSNVQKERKKALAAAASPHSASAAAASTPSTSASLPPANACPRFCARRLFWHHCPMILNGDQQQKLLSSAAGASSSPAAAAAAATREFPGRLRYPSWWNLKCLEGITAKLFRERIHAEAAPDAAATAANNSNKNSLASRTGTTELTFAQKMALQRNKRLGVGGGGLSQFQDSDDSAAILAGKHAAATSAEEDLSPYLAVEQFFCDGVYAKDSAFSKSMMQRRSRALTAATRLALGISMTTVLAPKQLVRHVEKSKAQAAFEQRLREQEELEQQRRAAAAAASAPSAGNKNVVPAFSSSSSDDDDDDGAGSAADSNGSTVSAPFSSDTDAKRGHGRRRRSSALSSTTTDVPTAASASLGASKRGSAASLSGSLPLLPRPQQQQPSVASSSCFAFVVEDSTSAASTANGGGGGGAQHNGVRSVDASSSLAAEAAATNGEIIAFVKGTVELAASATCVPVDQVLAYIAAAGGGAAGSNNPSTWLVVRIDSLLVGERRVDPATLESNLQLLREREEEAAKAAANPFYISKLSEQQQAQTAEQLKKLKKKPFARLDLALFLIKAVFETFRSGEMGTERVFLVASVDANNSSSSSSSSNPPRDAEMQRLLHEQFGLQSLSHDARFWKDVLGCCSFAPAVFEQRGGDGASEEEEAGRREVVFHMFAE